MPDIAGVTSTSSRTIHVVPGASGVTKADKGAVRTAACGRDVTVRWYEVGPATEVCMARRKAMGWPTVVTWTSQGRTFTTDFSQKD
jgi:hypothetical protein